MADDDAGEEEEEEEGGGKKKKIIMIVGGLAALGAIYNFVLKPSPEPTSLAMEEEVEAELVEGEILEVEIAKLRGGDKVKVRVSLNRIDQLIKPGQAGSAGSGSQGSDA